MVKYTYLVLYHFFCTAVKTWEVTVADKLRLPRVEQHMIRATRWVKKKKLVDRASERVSDVVPIETILMHGWL